MSDSFDLQRFVDAQNPVYGDVVAELSRGRKTSHWMWFIFPQIDGLGSSPTTIRYSIKSLNEAQAYLAHPLLSARLVECTQSVNRLEGLSARQIFGQPDDKKFHSSMTLFALATGGQSVFTEALDKYFGGVPDAKTAGLV